MAQYPKTRYLAAWSDMYTTSSQMYGRVFMMEADRWIRPTSGFAYGKERGEGKTLLPEISMATSQLPLQDRVKSDEPS